MVRFLADQGTSVLFVSHDLKEVLALAHRVTALRNGRVVESGVPVADLDESALAGWCSGATVRRRPDRVVARRVPASSRSRSPASAGAGSATWARDPAAW